MKWTIRLSLGVLLASLLFSGCAGQEIAETGPLRICVDVQFHKGSDKIPYANAERGARFLAKMVASHIDGLEEDDVELELIPASGTERKTTLTRIRTEIMSGEGPDVFLCSCPEIDISLTDSQSAPSALFPFPERAMEEGLFLPLDKYLKDAEWMEPDKMLPVAMEAGKTENGQMILPISYTMRMTAYEEGSAEPYPADTTFADVVASDDPVLRSTGAYAYRFDHWRDNAFPYLFANLADFKTCELAFTEDELYQLVLDAEALEKQKGELPPHFSEKLTWRTYGSNWFGEDPRQGIWGHTKQVMIPFYNVEGGATALIDSFAAVNANTNRPKSAFFVLDYFLSEYMHDNDLELYRYFLEKALPVRMDRGESSLGSEGFPAYCKVREQISCSRFCSALDQELAIFVTDYSSPFEIHSNDALRAAVSKVYSKMQRLLDES